MSFSFSKKQVAMFLLNAGADVSIQAKNGCTAFDMASLIGKHVILISFKKNLHSIVLLNM